MPPCFNPRVREGRDVSAVEVLPASPDVSIHASVKDATSRHRTGERGKYVSIHASVKDATLSLIMVESVFMFQSTRP